MYPRETIVKIERLAARIRRDIVEMIGGDGQTGHLGGSCSSADIVAALYGHVMCYDPHNPDWEERDKFLYSKGHAAIAQYAAMAEVGYFPREELHTTKHLGSRLQGHPDRLKIPGIEAGTGSLGQGLSIANGLALAMRLDGKNRRVFCVLGDGELAEGQIWEAAMFAAHRKLDNVMAFVDRNRLGSTGSIEERMGIEPLAAKWESFGWHVQRIDGHDVGQILAAVEAADAAKGRPSLVIAETVKGKGVSFAEDIATFHNGALTKEQYGQALGELNKRIAALD